MADSDHPVTGGPLKHVKERVAATNTRRHILITHDAFTSDIGDRTVPSQHTLLLIAKYYEGARVTDRNDLLVLELDRNIRWMNTIIYLVRDLERKALSIVESLEVIKTHELMDTLLSTSDLIHLNTTTFYWVAWRSKEIVCSLPELSAFNPVGVRQVRNKLIEHPHKGTTHPALMTDFSIGSMNGPILKAVRDDLGKGDGFDIGLYANADEFTFKLESILRNKSSSSTSDAIIRGPEVTPRES